MVLASCVALVAGFLLAAQPAASAPITQADTPPAPGEAEMAPSGPPPQAEVVPPSAGPSDQPVTAQAKKKKKKKKKKPAAPVAPPPPPVVPAGLSALVDPMPRYQGQGICDPTTKPGTQRLVDLIKATYVDSRSIWVPRGCSVGGRSEHKEGRALDWMINSKVPAQKAQADSFINWLLATDDKGNPFAMARRLGVMYIGWGDQIWESYYGRWSELKGCFSTQQSSFDTYCHRDHIHISLSWDGANGQTSFWGGDPSPAPFCADSRQPAAAPADPGAGLEYIPVTAQRIVDTRRGQGTPGGVPCRLAARSSGGPGSPLIVNVRGLSGSPGAQARAVAVRVTTEGSNSPATLRAVASGTLLTVAPSGARDVVSILPIATDGTVALTTDSGATHLSVDLLGYFVTPGARQAGQGLLSPQGNLVVYDTVALKSPLQPRESRVVNIGGAGTQVGPATGALVTVRVTGAKRKGRLFFLQPGTKSSAASPVIAYTRAPVTAPVVASLDAQGNVVIANSGKGRVDVTIEVQASAVQTTTSGTLLVPVQPTEIRRARSKLARILPTRARAAASADTSATRSTAGTGARAAVLRVSATGGGNAGTVTFFSGSKPKSPSLVVPARTTVNGLIVVPLNVNGTLTREVSGGTAVTAHVVAYLR